MRTAALLQTMAFESFSLQARHDQRHWQLQYSRRHRPTSTLPRQTNPALGRPGSASSASFRSLAQLAACAASPSGNHRGIGTQVNGAATANADSACALQPRPPFPTVSKIAPFCCAFLVLRWSRSDNRANSDLHSLPRRAHDVVPPAGRRACVIA